MAKYKEYLIGGTFTESEELPDDLGCTDWCEKHGYYSLQDYPEIFDIDGRREIPTFTVQYLMNMGGTPDLPEFFIELNEWDSRCEFIICKDMMTVIDFIDRYSNIVNIKINQNILKALQKKNEP